MLDERFTGGLRDVQRRYRDAAPGLVVPPAPVAAANPGTVGTAADWLLRFLLYPHPDVHLAMAAAAALIGPKMMRALADITTVLGAPPRRYRGPVASGPEPVNHLAGIEDLQVTRCNFCDHCPICVNRRSGTGSMASAQAGRNSD